MADHGESLTKQQIEVRIVESAKSVKEMLHVHDWERAVTTVEYCEKLKPNDPRVQSMRRQVERERESHKEYLRKHFQAAARQKDYDRAMELLKEMDRLMTRDEAAPMLETARKVIEQAKESLGKRFRAAVSKHNWVEAAHVAEIIISEFRNTRMAEEVAEKLTLLRERSRKQRASAGKRG
jgi:hypothetical protein